MGSIVPTSNIGTGGATPVPPTPITYLTKWKIVGNSEVHTDEYLTQWKVSGNSVVDNNAILSCGDLGQDGKYHVKISNGIDVFDIALDAPLRKVDSVADKIEFANNTAVITRNIATYLLSSTPNWVRWTTSVSEKRRYVSSNNPLTDAVLPPNNNTAAVGLCSIYNIISVNSAYNTNVGISVESNGKIGVYDADYAENETNDAFVEHIQGVELLYQLATPTTELVDVSLFPVSPTDTYTSANVVPYSAFEHTENKEIWSCGEYNPIDGKYHILVQPLGGSIVDIALTEPLRKVNNVADTIEFPSNTEGKALVTRKFYQETIIEYLWLFSSSTHRMYCRITGIKVAPTSDTAANILFPTYPTLTDNQTKTRQYGVSVQTNNAVCFYDENYQDSSMIDAFKTHISELELLYELNTPTTELIDAPQIEEADSYSMVISQGGKAVEWSDFETDSE